MKRLGIILSLVFGLLIYGCSSSGHIYSSSKPYSREYRYYNNYPVYPYYYGPPVYHHGSDIHHYDHDWVNSHHNSRHHNSH